MKKSLALASALLIGSTLTACGGSDADSDYCKDLKSANKAFSSLEGGDASQVEAAFKTFHKLAGEAPSDVKGDWKKLDTALTTVEKALGDAGLKLSELGDLQSGKLPEGVDMAKLQEAASSFSKLNSQDFTDATKSIEKHAKDVCKVDLS